MMSEVKPITTPSGENEKSTREESSSEGTIEQENMKKLTIEDLVIVIITKIVR